ncbi:GntR family transcriptional regulator [Candidatus Bipolaricaulota bacterium]|nr:GntR family transcriptional regulator [Candidatus Bipolaricaulota bacterium]
MLVQLERGSKTPYHLQIRKQLRELILSGALPPGSRLPATRDLARALGVNRTTVVTAYRALWSEGLVEGRAGGGTVVARPPEAPQRRHPTALPLVWEELYTARVPAGTYWTEGAVPKGHADVIQFDWGSPPPDLFPLDAVREVMADILTRGPNSLRYAPAQGDPELRRLLAERLELAGIRATPSQILILSGSEQGIFLVAQASSTLGTEWWWRPPLTPGRCARSASSAPNSIRCPWMRTGCASTWWRGCLPTSVPSSSTPCPRSTTLPAPR